jgi:mandelate racemase
MALSGLDMAAWDALAVRAGVALATLLGGRPRPIPAYNSLGMIPPAEATDAAAKTVAAGFKALKVKIGWPTLAEDLAVVRAARKVLGDDVALMVDFNQSLTQPEAIRRGRVLDGEGVAWIEEPVRADDYRGAAEVAAQVATPIQIGENFNGPYEMELALGASDLVMPDPQQIGGVTGWLRAAALAQTAGAAAPGGRDDPGARASRHRARVERRRRAALPRRLARIAARPAAAIQPSAGGAEPPCYL